MADKNDKYIAILGAGNWGTTLAVMMGSRGNRVRLWEYRSELAREIEAKRENVIFLPGVKLPPTVRATSELAEALEGADACLLALPSQTVREVCAKASPVIGRGTLVVSCVKGLEHGTLMRMTQVARECLGGRGRRLAALSGPNIASEIALGMPATAVVAAEAPEEAAAAQALLHTPSYRVYTSTDLAGVELGGALKNVIALAAGMIDGLGLGANTKGALVTRGLAEIARLGQAMGARPETFSGLSGLGDLVTTCVSEKSRNWQVGRKLGQGLTLDQALEGMVMVAEGVPTTESAQRLSKRHMVEMPITRVVHQILFQGKEPKEAIAELMSREARAE